MSNYITGKGRKANGRLSLREYLEIWLSDIEGSIKPNTYTAYYGHIRNHVHKSGIADMRLRDIKPSDIQGFVQGIESVKGGKLSGKTVRLIYDMLKTAFNCAMDYEMIDKNPCYRVRLPRHVQKQTRIISVNEQTVLERTIAESKDGKAFGVLVCLYTGIRLGELCALKWSDIDFENREMTVQRTLGRITLHGDKGGALGTGLPRRSAPRNDGEGAPKTAIVEDSPKTKKSNRVIPLPDFLITLLKARKCQSNSEYVVAMKNGRRVLPRTMQDVFKSLLKKSELERTNFHALRHTFATRAIELNVNICAVSEILGHSNISITISRYIHALKEQKLDAARYFDRFYKEKDIKKAMRKQRQTA